MAVDKLAVPLVKAKSAPEAAGRQVAEGGGGGLQQLLRRSRRVRCGCVEYFLLCSRLTFLLLLDADGRKVLGWLNTAKILLSIRHKHTQAFWG